MPSIFSKIVAGQVPCYKIAENENFLAFLDVFPLKEGHVLVIPKTEVDYLFDLDTYTYAGLMEFCKPVAAAIKNSIPCKRVSMHVIGLEVPHAHVHLIPISSMNDCNFANEKLKFSQAEFEATAKRIASHVKFWLNSDNCLILNDELFGEAFAIACSYQKIETVFYVWNVEFEIRFVQLQFITEIFNTASVKPD